MRLGLRTIAGTPAAAGLLILLALFTPAATGARAASAAPPSGLAVRPAAVRPAPGLASRPGTVQAPPATRGACARPRHRLQSSPGGTTPRTPRGMSDSEAKIPDMQMQCQLMVAAARPRVPRGMHSAIARGQVNGPLMAADLRDAYGLAAAASSSPPMPVAVVDAYRAPAVTADFQQYRQLNGLPACAPGTGAGCLTVLNADGKAAPLPAATDPGWANETALDVEMIAAICPNCHVYLLEASSALLSDLGTAENSAANVARFISNSWSGADFPGESVYDTLYFNHPGTAITFASGDYRYAANYPASSQLVTSVGGTYLDRGSPGSRDGWSEVAWSGQSTGPGTGTQSGCSSGEAKPAWQSDPGCANRSENDVAAVADAPAGVEFVSSAPGCGGICQGYGTSVATPVIAATYALAGWPKGGTYPAQYPYLRPGALNRVTSGSDGACEASRRYLCDAGHSLSSGYNGPAGLGTPSGTSAFAAPAGPGSVVSAVNPATFDLQAGLAYRLPAIRAYDSDPGQRLTFSAAGLPAGMSMNPANGVISGTVPRDATTIATVAAHVKDGSGAGTTVTFRIVGVRSLASAYRPGRGEVILNSGGMCLDDRGNSKVSGATVQLWRCLNDRAQQWAFRPGGTPGDTGTLLINGMCLDVRNRATAAGSPVQLWRCNGGGNQQWLITGSSGALYNPASGFCLDVAGGRLASGQPADIGPCTGAARQAWLLPPSPVTSGISGKCLDDLGDNSANGARIDSFACNGTDAQHFTLGMDGTIRIHGKCLNVTGNSTSDGAPVQLWACDGGANEVFQVSAWGMLESLSAQKCLAVPGNSTIDGTPLVITDCYGDPGQVWAVT